MAHAPLKRPAGRRAFLKTAAAAAVGAFCLPYRGLARLPGPAQPPIERAAFTMGSIVTFTVFHPDVAGAEDAIREAVREMKEVDRLMSVFDPASQLSQVNGRGFREEVPVDPRIIEVGLLAAGYCAATEGAFDITVGPLMEMYGFRDDARAGRFPGDAEIARAIEAVGPENILIDRAGGTVALARAGTRLDFGGIAVGYAVDRAVSVLRSRGIGSAIVNHSGDICAIGAPPGEEGWQVGIRDPVKPGAIMAEVEIRDQALCTSGNYEHFVQAGGRTIGHILDPRTGRSAGRLLSATIVAPSAVEADALSTAAFVMGRAGALALAASRPGVTATVR